MFDDQEKEYFYKLLKRFAIGFFVSVHTFCIMGTHFHILATCLEKDAKKADTEELYKRYKALYGKLALPPTGSYQPSGELIEDEDRGVERLRNRLGSISCFVRELKQTFSHWYNKKHNRKGYLWNDRFKGVLVDIGEAQLSCSAYIDLNPVRAGIVEAPEDYRWSSMGLRVRNLKSFNKLIDNNFLSHLQYPENCVDTTGSLKNKANCLFFRYRLFVYLSGGIEREGKEKIPQNLVEEVELFHGRLGIDTLFNYRVRNMSEGIAIGSQSFIARIQTEYNRKFIRPRGFTQGNLLYATRVLRN
jgi:REP element-mobilizing transposase RayT